jgi:hypothetical protein
VWFSAVRRATLAALAISSLVCHRLVAHPKRVIGYLSARSPEDTAHLVEAFRRGLSEAGFVEGQNVTTPPHTRLGIAHANRPPVATLKPTSSRLAAG